MGYDVHITRRAEWHNDDGPPIAQAEWLHVVEQDPELGIDRESYATSEGGDRQFAVSWHEQTLWFFEGEIRAKNPNRALIEKMVEIASCLNATVQGDDGERYPGALAAIDCTPTLLQRVFRRWR